MLSLLTGNIGNDRAAQGQAKQLKTNSRIFYAVQLNTSFPFVHQLMWSAYESPFPSPIHPLFALHHGDSECRPGKHLWWLILWYSHHRFVSLQH
jgi:hypothetical protein